MSNLTNPSRAALGDIRFPPNDKVSGEVITYYVPKAELRKRYGVPLNERISKKTLYRLRKEGMTDKQIAEKYRIEPEQVRALFQYYRSR